MSEKDVRGVHWSFWVVGAVGLTWNGLGGMNFFAQMDPDMVASFPESHRAIIEGRSTWATAAFALSVFGGAIGCLLLLLKKSIAFYVLLLSLLATIVTLSHALSLGIEFSAFDLVLTILMPLALAVLLAWYSRWVAGKGWIGASSE